MEMLPSSSYAVGGDKAVPPIDLDEHLDLLGPGPIQQIRLDLTTHCNLRCIYCAVSQPEYIGRDMPSVISERVVRMIPSLTRFHTVHTVSINGHGETTIAAGWMPITRHLIESNVNVMLTTNLARDYNPGEILALAHMHTIAVSIDSADRKLLQRMRRKVDVRQIVMNMHLIRMAAAKVARRSPQFGFLCGLYDKTAPGVGDLARLAVSLGVTHCSFWNLTPYPYSKTGAPEQDWPKPLDALSDDDLAPCLASINDAIAFLRLHNVAVVVQGDFISHLAKRLDSHE